MSLEKDSQSRKRSSRELDSLMRAINIPGPLSPMYRADTTDGTVSLGSRAKRAKPNSNLQFSTTSPDRSSPTPSLTPLPPGPLLLPYIVAIASNEASGSSSDSSSNRFSTPTRYSRHQDLQSGSTVGGRSARAFPRSEDRTFADVYEPVLLLPRHQPRPPVRLGRLANDVALASLPKSIKELLVEHLGYPQIGQSPEDRSIGVEALGPFPPPLAFPPALDAESCPSITSNTEGDIGDVNVRENLRADTPTASFYPRSSDQLDQPDQHDQHDQVQYHKSTDSVATSEVTDLNPNAPAPSPLTARDPDLTAFVRHDTVEYSYSVLGVVEAAIDRLREEHLCEIREIVLSSLTLDELNSRCQDLSALFETRRQQLYTLLAPRMSHIVSPGDVPELQHHPDSPIRPIC